jgi:hypothetical protein
MPGYGLRIARLWGQITLTGDEDHPDRAEACEWMMTALRVSGIGERIQLDGIAADNAGLVKDTGCTKHFANGTSVIVRPTAGQPS